MPTSSRIALSGTEIYHLSLRYSLHIYIKITCGPKKNAKGTTLTGLNNRASALPAIKDIHNPQILLITHGSNNAIPDKTKKDKVPTGE